MSTAVVRPVPGGSDLRRLVALTWILAVTEFKLRFYGSMLGYAWTLVRPFAFFGVIYVIFTEVVGVGDKVRNYPSYILIALVLFSHFNGVVSGCLGCLVAREGLLRKIRFPRLVIPLSIVLESLFELSMTLVAVTIFLLISGIFPQWSWLEMFPLVAILTLFATGLGLLLSVLFVRFRDMRPIWDVVGQMLFYASPILYVATMVPAKYMRPYLANPIAALLTEMRHALIDPTAAGAAEAIGGALRLLIPAGIVLVVLALGVWAFRREAPRVAENL